MATRIKDFDKVLPLILALPVGTHFDMLQYKDGEIEFGCQATTQVEKEAIMLALPLAHWVESYVGGTCDWWRYDAVLDNGIKVDIYAVKEPRLQEVTA